MPRKQRFKPSRKPKTEAPQAEPQSAPDDGNAADDRMEPRNDDHRGVIEARGESA